MVIRIPEPKWERDTREYEREQRKQMAPRIQVPESKCEKRKEVRRKEQVGEKRETLQERQRGGRSLMKKQNLGQGVEGRKEGRK